MIVCTSDPLIAFHFRHPIVATTAWAGGCGAMYNMEVESPLFKGKSLVAQHRMVNEVR